MNDITFFFSLFFGSCITIYLLWLICHYNGKIIFYFARTVIRSFRSAQSISQDTNEAIYDDISMPTICLTGVMPLAIVSIAPAALNFCFNSLLVTIILEAFLISTAFFIPSNIIKNLDILGIKVIRNNLSLLFYASLWCLFFALWATITHQQSLDRMISNTNPDMWAYVRRFAAMTTDNLSFYGGSDSFSFDGNSACAFLLGSPKKFSSFLGSLIIYPLRGSSLGIAIFQGMLGGILFICLFKEWFEVRLSGTNNSWLSKSILLTWALFAPAIYWLLVSAYFSNALFLIIVCLTLRQARTAAISLQIDRVENFICFFSILVIVLAFYPAFIPVIVLTYGATTLIYFPHKKYDKDIIIKIIFKFSAVMIACGAFFYLLFPSQLGLYEVQKSLNILDRHGSNFVPLNPWSLLQEKPKPMPLTRDFGWYINIIISLPFCFFVGRKIWQQYQKNTNSLMKQNLLAALAGIGLYGGYLLAFIALDHTYRLMKIAISLVYPLAIFGLLPFILWSKQKLSLKSAAFRNGVLILAIAHTIFHIYKVLDLSPYPAGNFILSDKSQLEAVENITIVGCKDVHVSQFYQRLVGLQIAINYPQLQVSVVDKPQALNQVTTKELVIYGETVPDKRVQRNTCHFSL